MISEGSTRYSFQTVKLLIYYGVLVRLATLNGSLEEQLLELGAGWRIHLSPAFTFNVLLEVFLALLRHFQQPKLTIPVLKENAS